MEMSQSKTKYYERQAIDNFTGTKETEKTLEVSDRKLTFVPSLSKKKML